MEWMVRQAHGMIEQEKMEEFVRLVDQDACDKHYPVHFYVQSNPGTVFQTCQPRCTLKHPDTPVHCRTPYCLIPLLLSRLPNMPPSFRECLEHRKNH